MGLTSDFLRRKKKISTLGKIYLKSARKGRIKKKRQQKLHYFSLKELEMFYLNSTLNFVILSVLVFQLEVYYKVDRLLTGITALQKGTIWLDGIQIKHLYLIVRFYSTVL